MRSTSTGTFFSSLPYLDVVLATSRGRMETCCRRLAKPLSTWSGAGFARFASKRSEPAPSLSATCKSKESVFSVFSSIARVCEISGTTLPSSKSSSPSLAVMRTLMGTLLPLPGIVLAMAQAALILSPGFAARGRKGRRMREPRTLQLTSAEPAERKPPGTLEVPTAMMRMLPERYSGTLMETTVPFWSTSTNPSQRAKGGSLRRLKGLRKRPPGVAISPPKAGSLPLSLA